MASLEFGYNPPTGARVTTGPETRGFELIRPDEFPADLERALDVAVQGFSSIWVSDHLQAGNDYRLECWTLLVWLLARYPKVHLGTIVMSNSFRLPSLMAKMAATLQALSGGRFILGYGAGWYKKEYKAYGYDYPSAATRLAMMEEGIQIIRGMWSKSPFSFDGRFYGLTDAICEPKPDPPPPIMIGGGGERRTLRLVARHADWWNDVARSKEVLQRKLSLLRTYCQDEGRDYDRIRKTYTTRVFIDSSHRAALEQADDLMQSENPPIAGDPTAVREQLHELAEMGIDLCQLTFPNFPATDDLQLFVDQVLPAFA